MDRSKLKGQPVMTTKTKRPADCVCWDYETPDAPCTCGASRLRARASVKLALALGAFVGAVGCRATVPPAAPEVETVGALAQGPSVYSAPVHPTTDLTPQFGAVESGDDVSSTVTTVTRAPDAAVTDGAADAPVELPDVTAKVEGLRVGEAR